MNCQRCKEPLSPDEAVWSTVQGTRRTHPICRDCDEALVRRHLRRATGVDRRLPRLQFSPGKAAREYHGGQFNRGEW